jgi:hypothetical protein
MTLPEQYKTLLDKYEKVLRLSREILVELENKGKPDTIIAYLKRKSDLAKTIADLTEQISSTRIENDKDPRVANLAQVKILYSKINEKTKQIQKIEEKIQHLLQSDEST